MLEAVSARSPGSCKKFSFIKKIKTMCKQANDNFLDSIEIGSVERADSDREEESKSN